MATASFSVEPVQELEPKEFEACTHYWLIDSPNGPTSKGVCRLCGVHQEFPNFVDGMMREEEKSWERGGAASSRPRVATLSNEENEP